MTNPDRKPKPIIGDDGELLQPDTNVDMTVYYDFAADEFPPPSRAERFRYFVSNNPLLVIIVLIVGVSVFSWSTIPPTGSLPLVSDAPSTALPNTSVAAAPTQSKTGREPTVSPNKKSVPQLPSTGAFTAFDPLPDINQIRWSPDGKYLALQGGANAVAIWDIHESRFLYYGSQPQSDFDWSSSSKFLYVILHKRQSALFSRISLANLSVQADSRSLRQPWILAYGLPKRLVTSSKNQLALLSNDGLYLSVTDLSNPTALVIRQLDESAHDLDWTPDGRWLSMVKETGIWRWQINSDAQLVLEGRYQQISWSLNGQEIAVTQDITNKTSHYSVLSVIDPSRKQVRWSQRLPQDSGATRTSEMKAQVEWSPDGKRIATFIENEKAVDLWDAETGEALDHFESSATITCIDWSPQGDYLAIGSDSAVTIWSPS